MDEKMEEEVNVMAVFALLLIILAKGRVKVRV